MSYRLKCRVIYNESRIHFHFFLNNSIYRLANMKQKVFFYVRYHIQNYILNLKDHLY
jgi:hypothetical protein